MAKRSDIEKQMAELQKQLDTADTDDEIWIKDESGHEIKVTGRRATSVLNRYAKLFEEKAEEGEEEEGQEEEEEKDPAPPAGYFGRKAK
jgi:hypothetical protein